MIEAGAADPGADPSIRRAFIEAILADPLPADRMLATLELLAAQQDLAMQAAVFEAVLWRVDVAHYWVYHRMSRVYADLGRLDQAGHMAALAVRLQPDSPGSWMPWRDLFLDFARRGDARGALDVFLAQVALFPEKPVADRHEIDPLMRELGLDPTAARLAPRPDLRADRRVAEAETRPPSPIPVPGGGRLPYGLEPLAASMERQAIDVAMLPGGELLVCNDAVVVCDAEGRIHADLSIGPYPELVRRRVLEPPAGAVVEQHAVAEAALIGDMFPPPNLGHFLLDQMSRLALYRRAGAELSRLTVVGSVDRAAFQSAILARAGVAGGIDTQRLARIRADRLWVSTNCRGLQHAAHLGAGWAIDHVRGLLGGQGAAGTRRLYVSRADSRVRQVTNEAALTALLAEHGFETIVPGHMPYDAQVAAFRAASHVIAPHGAALAHMVLCPPGARVLEIFHPLYSTWSYAILAAAAGVRYSALTGLDGLSDSPDLNDPDRVDRAAGRHGERNLRADLDAVRLWLREAMT